MTLYTKHNWLVIRLALGREKKETMSRIVVVRKPVIDTFERMSDDEKNPSKQIEMATRKKLMYIVFWRGKALFSLAADNLLNNFIERSCFSIKKLSCAVETFIIDSHICDTKDSQCINMVVKIQYRIKTDLLWSLFRLISNLPTDQRGNLMFSTVVSRLVKKYSMYIASQMTSESILSSLDVYENNVYSELSKQLPLLHVDLLAYRVLSVELSSTKHGWLKAWFILPRLRKSWKKVFSWSGKTGFIGQRWAIDTFG